LTRHVRDVVVNGEAKSVGRLPATQSIHFDVVLALRDRAGLQNFLQEVNDPATPFYRQFITPEEFTARFGPSQEDWDALVAFSKANGFEIVSGSRDAMDLRLIGTVANIERAFHVTLGVYQHPPRTVRFTRSTASRQRTCRSSSGTSRVWITTPSRIHDGEQVRLRKEAWDQSRPRRQANATTGSCPSASFCGSDMRAAYYGGTSLTGSGQNIGLFEYYGYDIVDLNNYWPVLGKQTYPAK